jgi:hypothetical protein
LSDDVLLKKFRENASKVLSNNKVEKAVKILIDLEKVKDISEVVKQVTL